MTIALSRALLWAGVLILATAARGQTTVTLLASVDLRTRTPGTLRLADIATIDGPEMEALAAIPVLEHPVSGVGVRIDVASVREAMSRARVHWGRITLRGSSCYVLLADPPSKKKASPQQVDSKPSVNDPQPIDLGGVPTVRTVVSARLVALFGVEPEQLRLAFDPADEALLSLPLNSRRVEVQPAATGNSPVVPVQVFVYEGDRIVVNGHVRATALVSRPVASARSPIERGTVITEELVSVDRQWLPPNARVPAPPETLVGQVACLRIAAGAVVAKTDIEAQLVVKRGEIVEVHVLSGTMTVRARARALGPARDGETVQLKLEGSEHPFTARMNGKGRAVMVVSDGLPPAGEGPGTGEPVGRIKKAGAR